MIKECKKHLNLTVYVSNSKNHFFSYYVSFTNWLIGYIIYYSIQWTLHCHFHFPWNYDGSVKLLKWVCYNLTRMYNYKALQLKRIIAKKGFKKLILSNFWKVIRGTLNPTSFFLIILTLYPPWKEYSNILFDFDIYSYYFTYSFTLFIYLINLLKFKEFPEYLLRKYTKLLVRQ